MRRTFITYIFLVIVSLISAQTLKIDAGQEVARVSPLIYGAGAEDVNHEIYGGLYDQRIFGESFEEDAVSQMEGWRQFDNDWTLSGDILQLITNGHGKIIYEDQLQSKGFCEVEVRLDGQRPIAGFILYVTDPGNGADRFNGYEIALDCDDRTFVFGKHQQNWQPIANFSVSFDPKAWNHLRVDYDAAHFVVTLNDKKIYEYTDKTNPLLRGQLGLRSFDGSASFRNLKVNDIPVIFHAAVSGVSSMWDPVGEGTFSHDRSTAYTGLYSQKFTGTSGTGVSNMGLNHWGIGLSQGEQMQGCIYLKGAVDKAIAVLQSNDGQHEYARQELTGITSSWQRFALSLTPDTNDPNARFAILLADDGSLWADQAMLYTQHFPYRKDITDAFQQQGLTFLRYGGCMVNASGFRVKDQMGPIEQRPPYEGWWYKNSSNGFGIKEFVHFARMIGTEPCFGVNIEDSPSDVLDLLRELEPYNIHYLQIGNEENINTDALSAYQHYIDRFLLFYDAIHPSYPDIQFISAAWWRSDNTPLMEHTFKALDGKCALWDYHPWTETFDQARSAAQEVKKMQQFFLQWNPQTTMRCAILEENGNIHNLQRGLTHAMMLNAVRRTNGFVPLDSPANALQPYLQNDNGWDQGQIFFDTRESWGQPPYYVQQMAARHHQPIVVQSSVTNSALDVTVTRNEEGDTLVAHIVNTGTTRRMLTLNLLQPATIRSIHATSISGSADDRNLPDNPEKIVPVEEELDANARVSIKGYSYTILRIVIDKADHVQPLSADAGSHEVYDLQGRRVPLPAEVIAKQRPGLYIANHQKTILK